MPALVTDEVSKNKTYMYSDRHTMRREKERRRKKKAKKVMSEEEEGRRREGAAATHVWFQPKPDENTYDDDMPSYGQIWHLFIQQPHTSQLVLASKTQTQHENQTRH